MRAFVICILISLIPLSVGATTLLPSSAVPIQILIDPGHGGIDSGATYAEVEEKKINLAIALQLYDILIKKGYQVILTRDRDEALSETSPRKNIGSRHHRDLVQRGDIIKYFTPQIVLSLHVNSGSTTKQGGLVLYHAQGQAYLFAQIVQQKLNQLAKINEHPLKNKRLYILNRSEAIALVVELGYLSNPVERERLQSSAYQQQLCLAVAEAIDEYMILFPWSIISQ